MWQPTVQHHLEDRHRHLVLDHKRPLEPIFGRLPHLFVALARILQDEMVQGREIHVVRHGQRHPALHHERLHHDVLLLAGLRECRAPVKEILVRLFDCVDNVAAVNCGGSLREKLERRPDTVVRCILEGGAGMERDCPNLLSFFLGLRAAACRKIELVGGIQCWASLERETAQHVHGLSNAVTVIGTKFGPDCHDPPLVVLAKVVIQRERFEVAEIVMCPSKHVAPAPPT
mmetsp:Transcript_1525/g.6046  ORF Transcript_1525/g.6046 Transcript_1525/m.6046 type:complete len:230 (-) Transcript_1525:2243-2932(-)